MDKFTPEKRSEIMSKIRGKNTKPEILLRKWLFAQGFRYRLHVKDLPGKPDIVLRPRKLVIFIDGDWWHGRNYDAEYAAYPLFWQKKIKDTMLRDIRYDQDLKEAGWTVVRIWAKDLQRKKTQQAELDKIAKFLKNS